SAHTGRVTAVAFSPDGKQLASCGLNDVISLWDLSQRKRGLVRRGHTRPITSLAFSADGKRLISGSEDGTARVWDRAVQPGPRKIGDPKPLQSVAFSADGRWLAMHQAGQPHLHDARTGQPVRALLVRPEGFILAFAPDSKVLAVGTVGGSVDLFEVDSGR